MNRLLLFAVVVLAAACGKPAPAPQDHFYRLHMALPAATVAPLLNGVLQVERFTASGLLAQRAIMHSKGDGEVHTYHYHAWVEVPAVMLQLQMVRYLRAAGAAKRIVTPEAQLTPDYRLQGRILRLEQRTASPPMGLVELELALIRHRDRKLLWLATYRQEVAAADPGVRAAVAAMSKAAGKIYARFFRDIAQIKARP